MLFKSRFQTRSSRASVQPTAAAVASLPVTAGPFSDNWRASSAAVAELAEGLDFIFDQVNYEEEPDDLLRLHLERLTEEAAKYANSRMGDCEGLEWSCSHELAQLLYTACQCSCLVYDPVATSGPELIPILTRSPVHLEAVLQGALIVSVRGTANVVDHMVNLNSEPKDASSILSFSTKDKSIQAHKGFLVCAKSLIPYLTQEIAHQLELDSSLSDVIFTGHSAGGSVSSLVFLHMISQTPAHLSSMRFSLATFGCAPVISSNLTPVLMKFSNVGWAYAFVNEYDMVPRADQPYIRSLVDLYRSRHGLPCLHMPSDPDVQQSSEHDVAKCNVVGDETMERKKHWPLPAAAYQLVGDIIILQQRLDTALLSDASSDTATITPMPLKLHKISTDAFANLLFCDVGAHKRRVYLQRMELMATGMVRTPSFGSDDDDTLYPVASEN
ncbi:hypothetical protein PT974_10020 [Cladobotryum mycophilum]|uniref:sn-1-specific diacylglycerol lipase n=1 Tax=Cladobotryum mycophilum TaxID=491253 RepID=A0ABR0S8P4_9HYPO